MTPTCPTCGVGIDEHEAGRCLDAWALPVLVGPKRGRIYYPDYMEDAKKEFPYWIPSGKPWRTHQLDAMPVPRLSTTWPGLGLVVEEMERRGFGWSIGQSIPPEKEAWVEFWKHDWVFEGGGPTPFLAAVRAAIKAVEEKR
jgi:hypothetical protein